MHYCHGLETSYGEPEAFTFNIMKTKRRLRQDQKKALRYCIRVSHPALFEEMGLGKTLNSIRFCKHKGASKILIVAPFSAFDGWQIELELEGEPQAIELTGTRKQRLDKLNNGDKWYLLNHEGHLVIPHVKLINWDFVILDESDFIKSPPKNNKSKTFGVRPNVSRFYCTNFKHIKNRMILTGTPAPEHVLEYFTQLYFLDPSILGFKNYYKFRDACFVQIGFDFIMKPSYKKKFYKKLNERCFFLTRKEAGLKGEKIDLIRKLKMTAEMEKVYKDLKENFILEYNKQEKKRTKYSPVLFHWLRELCSGFVDNDFIFSQKYDELNYLLYNKLKNKPVVIWCSYINEIVFLQSKVNDSKCIYGDVKIKEREQILRNFNKGTFKYLIANPDCIQYGTDLSRSDTMIFYSMPLGSKSHLQVKGRFERGEKKDSVLSIYLLMKNTIEEDIYTGLQNKKSQADIIRTMVKRLCNVNQLSHCKINKNKTTICPKCGHDVIVKSIEGKNKLICTKCCWC